MKITGTCHCGDIKYEAEVNEKSALICHCTDCQKLSGSAYRTVVMSKVNGFTLLTGQPKEYIKIAESGNKRAQGFCQNCGSALYATNVTNTDRVYGIRTGTVDQKEQLRPSKQIWCRSALSWIDEIGEIEKFEVMPQKSQLINKTTFG